MITIAKDPFNVADDELVPTGEPDTKALRAAALEKRRQAAARIPELQKEFAPKIAAAATALADAERSLNAAKEILRNAEAARLDAGQRYDGLVHQRDNAIGLQEKILWENRDPELRSLITSLDAELWGLRQKQGSSRRLKSRIAKLENAIERTKALERDPGIINTAKLELAMASLLVSGGIN